MIVALLASTTGASNGPAESSGAAATLTSRLSGDQLLHTIEANALAVEKCDAQAVEQRYDAAGEMTIEYQERWTVAGNRFRYGVLRKLVDPGAQPASAYSLRVCDGVTERQSEFGSYRISETPAPTTRPGDLIQPAEFFFGPPPVKYHLLVNALGGKTLDALPASASSFQAVFSLAAPDAAPTTVIATFDAARGGLLEKYTEVDAAGRPLLQMVAGDFVFSGRFWYASQIICERYYDGRVAGRIVRRIIRADSLNESSNEPFDFTVPADLKQAFAGSNPNRKEFFTAAAMTSGWLNGQTRQSLSLLAISAAVGLFLTVRFGRRRATNEMEEGHGRSN